jgi:hypothetical protein
VLLISTSLISASTYATIAAVPPVHFALLLAAGAVIILRFSVAAGPRPLRTARTSVVVVSSVALMLAGFWAATSFARDLGERAAAATEQDPRGAPVVTVFSREPLDLTGGHIQVIRHQDFDGEWSYRYAGARLLTFSNGRWFLITDPASSAYRPAVTILADSDKIRVETAVSR